jgi:hypothetical protein
MIVTPDKGIFFVATALMCSASLYGAELTTAGTDPMTRIFVGQPNLLTLPPGFPPDVATAEVEDCAPPSLGAEAALQTVTAKADEAGCRERELKPATSESPLRLPLDVANAKADSPLQPISAGSAAQAH